MWKYLLFIAVTTAAITMTAENPQFDWLLDPGSWIVLAILGYFFVSSFKKKKCVDPNCPVHGNGARNNH